MEVQVLFTPSARAELESAIEFIAFDKPQAARRFLARALSALKRLEAFPESGKGIAEYPESPFRELAVPPLRFFYRTQDDNVWIVAVWHCSRLPRRPG